jgi:hypothetical protein
VDSAQDEYGLFSFESVCGVLGLNPEYMRRGLLRWKDKELAQHRSHESWGKNGWSARVFANIRKEVI